MFVKQKFDINEFRQAAREEKAKQLTEKLKSEGWEIVDVKTDSFSSAAVIAQRQDGTIRQWCRAKRKNIIVVLIACIVLGNVFDNLARSRKAQLLKSNPEAFWSRMNKEFDETARLRGESLLKESIRAAAHDPDSIEVIDSVVIGEKHGPEKSHTYEVSGTVAGRNAFGAKVRNSKQIWIECRLDEKTFFVWCYDPIKVLRLKFF